MVAGFPFPLLPLHPCRGLCPKNWRFLLELVWCYQLQDVKLSLDVLKFILANEYKIEQSINTWWRGLRSHQSSESHEPCTKAQKTASGSTLSWGPGRRLSLEEFWNILSKDRRLIVCAFQDLTLLRMSDWERPHSPNLLNCRLATGSVPLKERRHGQADGGGCWSLTSIHPKSRLI